MNLSCTMGLIRFRLLFITIGTLFLPSLLIAQNDSIEYDITVSGLTSTGKFAPFWLQSNQYGKISSSPSSANFLIGINKEFGNQKRVFDYGFRANALVQTDKTKSTLYFHELYAKVRLLVFDLIAGTREEQFGNQDSTLSSGGFLFSQNARPIPKITIGIEHFTPVPFTKGYLEIKAALSNGWFDNNTYIQNELLHHKYAYIKVGGKLPVHFQYGLDHTVLWGGNIKGQGQQPTGFSDFLAIFFARGGGKSASAGEQINALGDHRISQSMKLDADLSNFKISGYWQNFSEDGPVRFMTNSMNIPDGLWGISLRNATFPFIKGIAYEYLNTTDQSGPYLEKDGIIYGGNDSYFTNYIYNTGWNNYSRTIGTPFITSPIYNKNGVQYTLNNRVLVHHFGIEGDVSGYKYKALTSFSKNYGTYSSPLNIQNTSALLEVNKQFHKLYDLEIGCSVGADFGKLFGNSVGMLVSIKKRGNLFSY
jgi:hypothetical protein